MAFHFTLQPLLRLRQSLEERERQRLLLLNGRLNQERQKLEQLKQNRIRAADRLAGAMREGMRACELHFESASQATQVQRQERVIQAIAELERQRLEQQSAYEETQKQRKIMENLRDRQLAAWRLDQLRREQRRLDDLFMLRQRRSTDFPRQ